MKVRLASRPGKEGGGESHAKKLRAGRPIANGPVSEGGGGGGGGGGGYVCVCVRAYVRVFVCVRAHLFGCAFSCSYVCAQKRKGRIYINE